MSCAATKLDLGAQSDRVDGIGIGKVIVKKSWGKQAWTQYLS